jgi:hypothetical protein
MSKTILSVCGLVVVGALAPAGCVGQATPAPDAPRDTAGSSTPPVEDEELSYTPSEPDGERVGEADEPFILLATRILCGVAAALATAGVCRNNAFWEKHCPKGTSKTFHDNWDKSSTVVLSCDTLRDYTCDLAGFAGGEVAQVVCHAFGGR